MINQPPPVETLDNQYPNEKSHAGNWLQTPPSQMPWGVPMANQPAIMRFTGDSSSPVPNAMGYTNHAFDMGQIMNLKCFGPTKRKICEDFEEMLPNKQLITEEKMAANLDGLHISNNYVAHQCGSASSDELPGSATVKQTTQDNHLLTLILCDELRRLTAEAVIPPAVIAKMYNERPTNALVLWQPPAGNLGARLQQIVDACKGTNTSNQGSSKSPSWNSFNNNNSSSTEDMNDPNSNKERQESSNSVPEDLLMEM